MKKKLLLIALLVIIVSSYSQTSSFGVGYNASFTNPKMFNWVIGRYNETRTWLDEKMPEIHYIDGAVWDYTWQNEQHVLSMVYTRRISTISASGDPGTGMMQRDINFRENTFSFGYGIRAGDDFSALALGANINAGANKMKTRVATPETIKEAEYTKVDAPLVLGFTFWLQLGLQVPNTPAGIIIRPYYNVDLTSCNYVDLNQAINPETYLNDSFSLHSKLSHFGLQIIVAIVTE